MAVGDLDAGEAALFVEGFDDIAIEDDVVFDVSE